jgi:hypothetical protein
MKHTTWKALQNCYVFLVGELETLDEREHKEEIHHIQQLITDIQVAINTDKCESHSKGKVLKCILPWFLIAALFTPTFPEYQGEDFTDSGVGCTDDCLEPAIEEEI